MTYLIRCIGYANGQYCEFSGQYLQEFDPDIEDPNQTMATFTPDPDKAKRFATPGDCFLEWGRIRTRDPVRPDGKPNKPLTALSIEMVLCEVVE